MDKKYYYFLFLARFSPEKLIGTRSVLCDENDFLNIRSQLPDEFVVLGFKVNVRHLFVYRYFMSRLSSSTFNMVLKYIGHPGSAGYIRYFYDLGHRYYAWSDEEGGYVATSDKSTAKMVVAGGREIYDYFVSAIDFIMDVSGSRL
jgi:hypothetical protein